MYTKEDFVKDMEFISELSEKSNKCYEYLGENEITDILDNAHSKLIEDVIRMFPDDIEDLLYGWIYDDFVPGTYEIPQTIKDYSVLYDYLMNT